MAKKRITRRKFGAIVTTAAGVLLAGCGDPGENDEFGTPGAPGGTGGGGTPVVGPPDGSVREPMGKDVGDDTDGGKN